MNYVPLSLANNQKALKGFTTRSHQAFWKGLCSLLRETGLGNTRKKNHFVQATTPVDRPFATMPPKGWRRITVLGVLFIFMNLISIPTVVAFSTPLTARQNTRRVTFAATAPAVIEKPETIIKEAPDQTEKQQRLGSEGWELRLYNDPFNKREFVARCLATICGKSDTEAFQIMMHAHKNGMGVVGRYQFEIAELYHNSLKDNGLYVDMVPVDDD